MPPHGISYEFCKCVHTSGGKSACTNSLGGTRLSIAARGAEQEGRNRVTRLRGPEVLGPLRGPRNSTLRFSNSGSRKPLPEAPQSPGKALRASGEALQGPRRGVSVFNGAVKQGGPLRGL